MNYEKYLPLGTVVKLKDATKRIMIIGFLCTNKNEQGTMYDYAGCLSPEGIISPEKTLLFNHEQIEQIYHLGLIDEEETKFKNNLKKVIEITNNSPNEKES